MAKQKQYSARYVKRLQKQKDDLQESYEEWAKIVSDKVSEIEVLQVESEIGEGLLKHAEAGLKQLKDVEAALAERIEELETNLAKAMDLSGEVIGERRAAHVVIVEQALELSNMRRELNYAQQDLDQAYEEAKKSEE